MGYDIDCAVFHVAMKNEPVILDLCRKFHDDQTLDIKQTFHALRYKIDVFNETIYVRNIIHQFKWHGDEHALWNSLAPYIKDGYIIWYGEDGDVWRYNFTDGIMSVISQNASII